jgi:hypothetical protein
MRRLVLLAFAGLVGSVAPSLFSSAQAQVGVEIGPRGPRIYDDRGRDHPRYERRRRVIEEDDDDDCRIVERRSINRFGERVVRRERICD